MGDFKQRVFGVNLAFNGTLLETPISPVSLIFNAPGTASSGIPSVLIGDFPVLKSTFRDPPRAQ